jgi:hypothetical protein
MLFEIEPFGVNDAFLRLRRNGGACITALGGLWNGLVRLNYLVAPSLAVGDPHLVFRSSDVGWDGDRFQRRGRASPLVVDEAMIDVLCQRGLVAEAEANRLLVGPAPSAEGGDGDDALMLRAVLGGCSFSPVYDDRPRLPGDPAPALVGYALRTLSARETILVEARDGLPVLGPEARARLVRELR